jgi:hypothetical protein
VSEYKKTRKQSGMEEKSRDEYGGEREQRANLDVNIKRAHRRSRKISERSSVQSLCREDIKVK